MNIWQRVIDEECVTWGIDVNDDATYEEAKQKLNKLLCIIQAIATDPKVNGGYALVPIEPTEAMIDAWWDTHIDGEVLDEVKAYKAMIQAAQEQTNG